jgi:hypothetical protein
VYGEVSMKTFLFVLGLVLLAAVAVHLVPFLGFPFSIVAGVVALLAAVILALVGGLVGVVLGALAVALALLLVLAPILLPVLAVFGLVWLMGKFSRKTV